MPVRLASIAMSLMLLLLAPRVAPAAVDIDGPWYVGLYVDYPGQPPLGLVKCHWDVVQSGTTLSVTYTCSGNSVGAGSTGTYTGTIDAQSGGFVISDASSSCLGGVATFVGQVRPDSQTFSGGAVCNNLPVAGIDGSRCQNGTVDAGEACDRGFDDAADCCSDRCQLQNVGTTCGGDPDGNACTSQVCDGASDSCPAPVVDLPAGTRCGPEAICSVPACDGAGSCSTTAPLADGTSCGGNPCFHGFGTCRSGTCSARQSPAGTPCETDGNACTVEACNAAGVCTSGGCSACCDDSGGSCIPAYDATCEQPIAAHSRVAMSFGTGSLAWTWGKGDETDFGAPQASGATLCAYDGLTKQLIAADEAAPGTCGATPCWKTSGSTIRYRGSKGSTLRSITLREGATTARITAQVSRHPFLAYWATWPIASPLRVQLKIGDSCWESTFLQDDERQSSRRRYVATGGTTTPVP
jgi:hypothetical protein